MRWATHSLPSTCSWSGSSVTLQNPLWPSRAQPAAALSEGGAGGFSGTLLFELTSGAMEKHKGRSSLICGEFADGLQTRIIVKHSLRDYLHNGNFNRHRSAIFFFFRLYFKSQEVLFEPPPPPNHFPEIRVTRRCVRLRARGPDETSERGRVIPPRCWEKRERASKADNLRQNKR